jgi:hypothetical protein
MSARKKGEKAVAGFSRTGERRRAMRTVKWNPFLSGVVVLLGSALLAAGGAQADVSTTNPAAILIFPKLEVDSSDGINTVVQITNTSAMPASVRCFYVNANGHCSTDPEEVCNIEYEQDSGESGLRANNCADVDPPGVCVPGWIETDFRFHLTPHQPVVGTCVLAWVSLLTKAGPGDFNVQSSIPRAPEDPFRGELKCILVGDDELPIDRNWLKGEASITTAEGTSGPIDVASYNAYGIQAVEGANNRDNTLILGEEYNACPNIVEIIHYFDDAEEPANGDEVETELTFVPCSQDFNLQIPKRITVQFLVFNEFEQRFSTSRPVECLTTVPLSDIVPRPGDDDNFASIFNVAVQGTLTGKTLARGVNDDSDSAPGGETFLVLVDVEQSDGADYRATYAAHQRGSRVQPDIIELPAAAPTGP